MKPLIIPHEEVFVIASLNPPALKVLWALIVFMKRSNRNYVNTSAHHLTYYTELSKPTILKGLRELYHKNIIIRSTRRYQKEGKYQSLSSYSLKEIKI